MDESIQQNQGCTNLQGTFAKILSIMVILIFLLTTGLGKRFVSHLHTS